MDPSSTPEQAVSPAADSVCPRCGNKLANPETLGWCSKCGYCRSLEQDGKVLAATSPAGAARKGSPLGILEFIEVLKALPR